MIPSKKKATYRLISLLIAAVVAINGTTLLAGKSTKTTNQARDEAQKSFFPFVSKLYNWAAIFYLMRKDEAQDIREIFFKITPDKAEKFYQVLNENRQVLLDLNRFGDLNMVEGVEVIPQALYDFIRSRYALSSLQEPIDKKLALVKLIGGNFDYGEGEKTNVEGIFSVIENLNLNKWQPVKKFIDNFESSVNRDLRLAHLVGKSLLPLARHYFGYLDVISRLRIFNEVVDDALFLGIDGEDPENDIDQVAIKVFQTSGPVMMKLLQQLQDETKGETAMTRVLKGIEHCKPMAEKKAYKFTKEELSAMTGNADVGDKHYGFRFRPEPLGIASIAQTHLFSYRQQEYVIKIQKERVADIFNREARSLERLVSTEEEFDKGMKQKIANIHAGIVEELDFNFERSNIESGFEAYNDPDRKITTIQNPAELRKKQGKGPLSGSKQVLIMTKAEGKPLSKVMEKGDKEELLVAYQAMQRVYEKFLDTALNPRASKNFYHGDLHRGNIFLDPKSQLVTMIDFGNAGALSRSIRQAILEIYASTSSTYVTNEKQLDQAILELGKVMEEFSLKFNKERIEKSKTTKQLIKTFFAGCFNPALTPRERINSGRFLAGKFDELKEQKKLIAARLEKGDKQVSAQDMAIVQDDMDFVKALQNNCFNGPTNPLLIALANPKMLVSDKLNTVFQELQKNGLVMPKEVIFFNKSKALLEGILTNLDNSLTSLNASYTYVDPDEIYRRVLANVGESSAERSASQSEPLSASPASTSEQRFDTKLETSPSISPGR